MKKSTKQKIILGIILLLVIILLAIFVKSNNNTSNKLYENLNIDNSKLNIFYLNVGQADSTLIMIDGYTMLIDAGNDSDGYYITEFLKSQNVNKIDYFIITHFDEDHMGGAYKILEELDIGVLYMPNNSSKTQTYQTFIDTINRNNINADKSLVASKDTQYSLGNATWKVLNINGENLNDSSIVVELSYKDTKYLFMGDATINVEAKIDWDKIDVLKVGHHGSNTSTSQYFLDKVKPRYAIISVGANNNYGLPTEEIINRLLDNNITIYRTDRDNTIWLTSDGITIDINLLKCNLDGKGRKHANIFERKYSVLSFNNYKPHNMIQAIIF